MAMEPDWTVSESKPAGRKKPCTLNKASYGIASFFAGHVDALLTALEYLGSAENLDILVSQTRQTAGLVTEALSVSRCCFDQCFLRSYELRSNEKQQHYLKFVMRLKQFRF